MSDFQGEWANVDVLPNLNANALRAAKGPSLFELRGGSIGVFDSGLGGLSVLRHLSAVMPQEHFVYFADNLNVPYGDKSESWIRARMVLVTQWFLQRGCKAIVWACNTATAAGLTFLRSQYPEVFFVGLEPAIKPAVELSVVRKVVVLATMRTLQSVKYQQLLRLTVPDESVCSVLSIGCVGWAEAIDSGLVEGVRWHALLTKYLTQVQDFGADVAVLGCTHYPFIAADIQAFLGDGVRLIDSGAPVARYTQLVLALREGLRGGLRGGARQNKPLGYRFKVCSFDDQNVHLQSVEGKTALKGSVIYFCTDLHASVIERWRYLSRDDEVLPYLVRL